MGREPPWRFPGQKLACNHFHFQEPESPGPSSSLRSSGLKSLLVCLLLHLEPVFPGANAGVSRVSLEVVPLVMESKAGCRRGQGSALPGRLSRVRPVLPSCPRLPLPSDAGTVTAHGSAPRTRPSELPPLTWSLELLRRWEVRDTRL